MQTRLMQIYNVIEEKNLEALKALHVTAEELHQVYETFFSVWRDNLVGFAAKSDTSILDYVLNEVPGVNPNVITNNSRAPMFVAVSQGLYALESPSSPDDYLRMVELLLKAGANPNCRNKEGLDPIQEYETCDPDYRYNSRQMKYITKVYALFDTYKTTSLVIQNQQLEAALSQAKEKLTEAQDTIKNLSDSFENLMKLYQKEQDKNAEKTAVSRLKMF